MEEKNGKPILNKFDPNIRIFTKDKDHCEEECYYNITCACCDNHMCVGIWLDKDSIGCLRTGTCKEKYGDY